MKSKDKKIFLLELNVERYILKSWRMTRELSIYKWERRHSSLLKRRHLADRNRTNAFPTHTNVTFFFFLALMLSYLRWPMKIRLNLILDGGKHRAAPQRKQMIILLTLWIPGMVSFFKVQGRFYLQGGQNFSGLQCRIR